jgi:hypothetical protein
MIYLSVEKGRLGLSDVLRGRGRGCEVSSFCPILIIAVKIDL